MATKLVVIQPFASYQRGDEITNPADIDAILASESAAHVVQAAAPDAPAKPAKGDAPAA